MVTIEEKMVQLASVCYSLEVLRKRPLPSDVDPLRIEDCVKEEDFEVSVKILPVLFSQLRCFLHITHLRLCFIRLSILINIMFFPTDNSEVWAKVA